MNLFAAHRQDTRRAATPAPCRPAHPVYGALPAGLRYVPAPAPLRRRTLRALKLGPGADLQLVKRGGVTYGEVVGVPTGDPQGFVDHVVREAKAGHAKVGHGPGYSLIPFGNDVVAVGVRGCRAVYVAAATPDDVRVLASAVFK